MLRMSALEDDGRSYASLQEEKKKEAWKITEELVSSNLLGYYFIPHIDPSREMADGYVVLLRQPETTHRTLATAIAEGLLKDS